MVSATPSASVTFPSAYISWFDLPVFIFFAYHATVNAGLFVIAPMPFRVTAAWVTVFPLTV